jgi:hypothetical protein
MAVGRGRLAGLIAASPGLAGSAAGGYRGRPMPPRPAAYALRARELRRVAAELRRRHAEAHAERREVLRFARAQLAAINPQAAALHLVAGRGLDAAGIVGLDEVAAELESRWPGLFRAHEHASDQLFHLLIDGMPPPLSVADSLGQADELLYHSPSEDDAMRDRRPARRPGAKAAPPPTRPPLDAETLLAIGLVVGQDLARAKATTARSDLARLVVLRTLAALGVAEVRPPAKVASAPRRRNRPAKAGQAAGATDGGAPADPAGAVEPR